MVDRSKELKEIEELLTSGLVKVQVGTSIQLLQKIREMKTADEEYAKIHKITYRQICREVGDLIFKDIKPDKWLKDFRNDDTLITEGEIFILTADQINKLLGIVGIYYSYDQAEQS